MATFGGLLTSLLLWCSVLLSANCFSISAFIRHRREISSNDTYTTSKGLKCALCPAGYYVKTDCTTMLGQPACAECEINTYMDHANSESKCEPCTTCDDNGNLDKSATCSKTQNTECKCKENFYCDEEPCKVCHSCDTCENSEVQTACSDNSNTVCGKPQNDTTAIVIVVILLVIFVAIIIFFILKKKKWLPQINFFTRDPPPQQDTLLKPKDISTKLDDIAGVLSLSQVKRLCRQTLNPAQMDNIEIKYRDAHEEAYHLLVAWHEKEGTRAYSKLLNFLTTNTDQRTTEQVKNVVEDIQVQSEENEN